MVTAGRFPVIGQILKHKTFIEGPEGGRHLAEIIGRADDQPVRYANGVQHLRQSIAADAVSFVLRSLAAKTGNAAGVLSQTEQGEFLHDRARRLGAFRGLSDQGVRVPAISWASIDRNVFLLIRFASLKVLV